jgi:hypothetical protein
MARWAHIHNQAKLSTIGQTLDEAMEVVEKENKDNNFLLDYTPQLLTQSLNTRPRCSKSSNISKLAQAGDSKIAPLSIKILAI